MTLTTKQRRAVDALLSGANRDQASAAAGVSVRTLDRWRGELPAFQDELRRRGREAVEGAAWRLRDSMKDAADVLTALMQDQEAPASVRLRAAQAVIDSGLKVIEAADILDRLEALEAVINA